MLGSSAIRAISSPGSGSATTIVRRPKKRPAAIFPWKSGRVLCAPPFKACGHSRSPAGFGGIPARLPCRWRKTTVGPCRACSARHSAAMREKSQQRLPRRRITCRISATMRRARLRQFTTAVRRCRRRTSPTLGFRDKSGGLNPENKTFSIRCSAVDTKSRCEWCSYSHLNHDLIDRFFGFDMLAKDRLCR
jgi:hypothetical protein